MTPEERLRVRRAERRTALRRLGALNVECPWCGETDPLCFDVEHPERRAVSKFVWALCKNCHAKKSSRAERASFDPAVRDRSEGKSCSRLARSRPLSRSDHRSFTRDR